ncbi:uncharacterized protein LOC121367807 [Gigantopelta aegis]|uniref:uncharacterized protein LOC121367807 n=1 Tax=Gigantopelta aegis TaxID=1735272 RepID=UPI001B888F98|nr:uncharacterized protein LOC121367807 [Gigantopelta aegis]
MSYTCVSVPTVGSVAQISRSRASSHVRYERGKAVRLFSAMVLPHLLLGGMVVCAGIVTVYVESLSPAFPFVTGTDIISGLTTIFTGGLAYKISKENIYNKLLRSQAKYNVFLYGFLCILCVCLSFVSIGAAGYRTYLCTLGASAKEINQKIPYRACQARRKASLALAITDIVLESFLCAISVLGFWIFANYRFVFGCITSCDVSGKRTPSASDGRRGDKRMNRITTRQTISSVDSSRLTSLTDAQLKNALLPVNNRMPRGNTFIQRPDDIDSRFSLERPVHRMLGNTDVFRNRPERRVNQKRGNLGLSRYGSDNMMLRHLQSGVNYGRTQERGNRSLYGDVQSTHTTDYNQNVGVYRNRNTHLFDVNNSYTPYPSGQRYKPSALDGQKNLYRGTYSVDSRLPQANMDSDTW